MKNARQSLVLFLTLISVAMVAWAASKSQPEFDQIKLLAGDWEGKSVGGGTPVHINYKVVSGGSAVMETDYEKAEAQMITVYYLDGDQLMMTHYCMANNQPRMRSDPSTSSPTSIKFSFVDVTNLSSPGAGHMYAHSIVWKDVDHITQHWTWRQAGKDTEDTFELTRKK